LPHICRRRWVDEEGVALGYVLAIGAANIDILGTAQGPLKMGDSNLGRIRTTQGGVARNVAENLARLGIDTHLLSAVGDDALGHNVLAATRQAGVNTQACWVLPDAATSTYLSVHSSDGDMTVAVNDMEIVQRITPALLAQHANALKLAQAVVLDCNLSEETLSWICHLKGNAPIFVDGVSAVKCLRIKPSLGKVHTLKLNQLEAQTFNGMPCNTLIDMQTITQHLHLQGVQQVVISLGAQGVFWSDKKTGSGTLEALPCTVVNTAGAGDALTAGLVYAYLQQKPLHQAASFAQGCAVLTLGAPAANHPNLSVAAVMQLLPTVSLTSPL
jgi:pseudouridine kinase